MTQASLVADIGGTHARFALAEPGEHRPTLRHLQSLPTADFASLQEAASHYFGSVGAQPTRAAMAVASPAQGDHIQLTNCDWSFNRQALAAALGLETLQVINDFGAAARAIPALEAGEFEMLHGSPGRIDAPVSVIGPGTGMGMALLIDCPQQGWRVIETEGGHVGFAPQNSDERRIHDWLATRHGRVSVERVLSGSGLAKLHAALTGQPASEQASPDAALRSPADIVAAALAGNDPTAQRSLASFCAALGSVAGDAALMHGARTIAIGGGIVPRFLPFLQASAFRERLLDKGRLGAYVAAVQVLVITHPNPGLLGAALSLGPSRTSEERRIT